MHAALQCHVGYTSAMTAVAAVAAADLPHERIDNLQKAVDESLQSD